MRILLVVTGLPSLKTPARSVFNFVFAKRLRELGHNVTFIYLRSVRLNRPFIKIISFNGIPCIEVSSMLPKNFLIQKSTLLAVLFKVLLKSRRLSKIIHNVEVIHAIGGGTIESAYMISENLKRPFISQFIGSDLNVNFSIYYNRRAFVKGVEHSRYICFNSKNLRNVFERYFSGPFEKRVIYRGVMLDDFPFEFIASDRINFLFLGGFPNMGNNKGGLTLLEAITLLGDIKLSRRVCISIGGTNSDQFCNYFAKRTFSDIELKFLGAISRDEVKEQMRKSHVVIIPSLTEGLPNVLFESMASGNMILASNVGGIPEFLEEGKEGYLFKPNRPDTLAKMIVKCTRPSCSIEIFARNGRQKIQRHDYSSFIKSYLNLYRDISES